MKLIEYFSFSGLKRYWRYLTKHQCSFPKIYFYCIISIYVCFSTWMWWLLLVSSVFIGTTEGWTNEQNVNKTNRMFQFQWNEEKPTSISIYQNSFWLHYLAFRLHYLAFRLHYFAFLLHCLNLSVSVCECGGYCSFPQFLWEPLRDGQANRTWISRTEYFGSSDLWEKQKHITVKETEIIIQHKVSFHILSYL